MICAVCTCSAELPNVVIISSVGVLQEFRCSNFSTNWSGLFGTKVFFRKNEGNENGGKEDEETVWSEGNEWTLSSGSL